MGGKSLTHFEVILCKCRSWNCVYCNKQFSLEILSSCHQWFMVH